MHKFIAESGAVQASNARQLANEPTAPATDSVTLIYDVRLITPMFGGGTAAGTPDMDMPFRTKFIKGALRHWWRLLARAGDLDTDGDQLSSLCPDALIQRERTLWGMLSSGERPSKSAVGLRVSGVEAVEAAPFEIKNSPPATGYSRHTQARLLAYALFPAQHQDKEIMGRDIVLVNATFKLTLTLLDGKDRPAVEKVVLAWSTFGGLGGRTRRGIGAVEVHKNKTLLCAIDQNGQSKISAIDKLIVAYDLNKQACFSAIKALGKGLDCYHRFRTGDPIGRNGPRGRSHWPEADLLRLNTGDHYVESADPAHRHVPKESGDTYFPRADFGLPITIKFKQDRQDRQVNANGDQPDPDPRMLTPFGSTRAPSRMIIRPYAVAMPNGTTRYKVFAALLRPDEMVDPPITKVNISPPAGTLELAEIWNTAWMPGLGGGQSGHIRPLEEACTGTDAVFPTPQNTVEVFLNYFAQQ